MPFFATSCYLYNGHECVPAVFRIRVFNRACTNGLIRAGCEMIADEMVEKGITLTTKATMTLIPINRQSWTDLTN